MKAAFWLCAWLAASLPWLNHKVFGIFGSWSKVQATAKRKPLWLTLIESLTLYSVVWLAMLAIEAQQGQRANQTWQFYTVALCLWVVLSFPAAAWFKLRKS